MELNPTTPTEVLDELRRLTEHPHIEFLLPNNESSHGATGPEIPFVKEQYNKISGQVQLLAITSAGAFPYGKGELLGKLKNKVTSCVIHCQTGHWSTYFFNLE